MRSLQYMTLATSGSVVWVVHIRLWLRAGQVHFKHIRDQSIFKLGWLHWKATPLCDGEHPLDIYLLIGSPPPPLPAHPFLTGLAGVHLRAHIWWLAFFTEGARAFWNAALSLVFSHGLNEKLFCLSPFKWQIARLDTYSQGCVPLAPQTLVWTLLLPAEPTAQIIHCLHSSRDGPWH